MRKIHIVATTDYGLVTIMADRVFHTDTGALLFFSWGDQDSRETQTATFAPGAWRLHLHAHDENTKIALLGQLEFAAEAKRDANRVDDPA